MGIGDWLLYIKDHFEKFISQFLFVLIIKRGVIFFFKENEGSNPSVAFTICFCRRNCKGKVSA